MGDKNEVTSLEAGLFLRCHPVKMPGEKPAEPTSSGSPPTVLGEVDTVTENGILKAFLLRSERRFNLCSQRTECMPCRDRARYLGDAGVRRGGDCQLIVVKTRSFYRIFIEALLDRVRI